MDIRRGFFWAAFYTGGDKKKNAKNFPLYRHIPPHHHLQVASPNLGKCSEYLGGLPVFITEMSATRVQMVGVLSTSGSRGYVLYGAAAPCRRESPEFERRLRNEGSIALILAL